MRAIAIVFFAIGVLFLCTGMFMTPSLVASHFSPDGVLELGTIQRIQNARLLATCVGAAIALVGGLVFTCPGLLLQWVSHLARLEGRLFLWASWLLRKAGHLICHAGGWVKQTKAIWVLLLIIIALGLGIRCYFYIGLVRPDSFWTTASAYSLTQSGDFFKYANYYGRSRLVLIYGTWLMFELFGPNDISASILPMLFSIATILLIFLIGRKLWTAGVGLLAATIYAIAPPSIAISSFLLPDPIMPFFMSLAVLLFLYGQESKRCQIRRMLLFLTGVTIMLSFFVRENGPVAIGIFATYWLLFDRHRWRDYLWVVSGFILALAPSLLLVWDDVVLFFGLVFAHPGSKILIRMEKLPFYKLKFLTNLLTQRLFQFLYIPALGTFLYSLFYWWRRRKTQGTTYGITFVLAWFFLLYLYLDLIGPWLHGNWWAPRYASILLPPAVLALAWGMWRFLGFVQRRAWSPNWKRMVSLIVPGYLIFIMAISYTPLKSNQHQHYNVNYYWKVPATYLGKLDPKSIHFIGDNVWNKKMSFFLDYRWPDAPYYARASKEEVYPGVKEEYLPIVLELQEDFLQWQTLYVHDESNQLPVLGPFLRRIEEAYVLVNPNTFAKQGLDYLIPEDWEVVRRFQDVGNWRERDRILYWAPQRKLPALSQAWVAEGIRLAEKGLLEDALARLRMAIMLDPTDQLARTVHEELRNQLFVTGSESDELDVALLRSGTRIEEIQGRVVNPLYSVAEALTLPRDNRWISGHYLYFDGENELPISITLNFEQSRRVHYVAIRWKNYPSITGSSWKILYDPGDGSWSLLDEVRVGENTPYELLLSEPLEMQRLKVMVTSVNESETAKGIRIERIIVY